MSSTGRAAANAKAQLSPLTHQGQSGGQGGRYTGTHRTLDSSPCAPLTSCFPSKLQPLVLPNPGRATPWSLGCCAVPGAWPSSPGSDPSVPWNKVLGLQEVPEGERALQAATEWGRTPAPLSPQLWGSGVGCVCGRVLPGPSEESFYCPPMHAALPACSGSPGLAYSQGAGRWDDQSSPEPRVLAFSH